MAFLRIDNKKSGKYLRIVQSYKVDGKPRHKTLYSLGKVEDYSPDQLESIAKKLMLLAGRSIDALSEYNFHEVGRYNYGYALILNFLWSTFNLNQLVRKLNNKRKIKFNWQDSLRLMIAERLNDPCSKLQSSFNQSEYFGLVQDEIELHHLYRTLDLLASEEELVKAHIFQQHRSLFTRY